MPIRTCKYKVVDNANRNGLKIVVMEIRDTFQVNACNSIGEVYGIQISAHYEGTDIVSKFGPYSGTLPGISPRKFAKNELENVDVTSLVMELEQNGEKVNIDYRYEVGGFDLILMEAIPALHEGREGQTNNI